MDFPIEFGYKFTTNGSWPIIPMLTEFNENTGELIEAEPLRLQDGRERHTCCEVCWSRENNESKIIETFIMCVKQPEGLHDVMYMWIEGNDFVEVQEVFCQVALKLCLICRRKHKLVMSKSDHVAIGITFDEIFDSICNVFESSRWENVFERFSNKKLIKSANLAMKVVHKANKDNDGIFGRLNQDVLSIIGCKVNNIVRVDAVKAIENMWYNKSILCDDCGIRRVSNKLIAVKYCVRDISPSCCIKKVCIDTCSYWCINKDCYAENYFNMEEMKEFEYSGIRTYECWKCLQTSTLHIKWKGITRQENDNISEVINNIINNIPIITN